MKLCTHLVISQIFPTALFLVDEILGKPQSLVTVLGEIWWISFSVVPRINPRPSHWAAPSASILFFILKQGFPQSPSCPARLEFVTLRPQPLRGARIIYIGLCYLPSLTSNSFFDLSAMQLELRLSDSVCSLYSRFALWTIWPSFWFTLLSDGSAIIYSPDSLSGHFRGL